MNNILKISKNTQYKGFPPDIKVILGNTSAKSISEIKVGEEIYVNSSMTDQVQDVKKVMYRGIIKEIRCTGQVFKIKSIENQKFYVIRKEIRDYCRRKYSKINLGVLEKNIEILSSEHLKNGDFLLIPKHHQVNTKSKMKTEEFVNTFSNKIRMKILGILDFTKQLFRWFGYYLAEGMILFTSDKRYNKKCSGVSFTIGINEKCLLNNITCYGEEIFGIKPKVIGIPERNAYRINFYNTQLGELIFNLFNTGSSRKRIHPFLFSTSEELLRELINGWLKGDGWVCQSREIIVGNTSSIELADQIYFILINMGELPTIGLSAHKNQNRHKARELGYYLRHNLYNIRLYKNKNRSHRKQNNFYVFTPILSTNYNLYEGYIFNLKLRNSNSFQVNYVLVNAD